MRGLRPVVIVALLAGCKFGDQGGSAPRPDPAPPSTPTPPPPTPPPPPPPPPPGSSFAAQAAALYAVQPNIGACQAGELAATVRSQFLTSINRIRALHRLPAVSYSIADEGPAMAAALIMAANGKLNHFPDASWKCYSENGALGAKTSNLAGGWYSPSPPFLSNDRYLTDWLTDVTNAVADNVGHRRWILYPFLGSVGLGRVAGRADSSNYADASALKVISTAGPRPDPASVPPFVAYPFEEYPADLFDPQALLSFSVVADPAGGSANSAVDFSRTSVTVRERGGAALALSRLRYDNDGYGLPNNIQFFASGLRAGPVYDVTISNVLVGSDTRNYTYFFHIVS